MDFTEEEADVVGDSGVGVVGMGGGAEGDDGEVAVVAAPAAEGEVDVGGGGWGNSTNRWRALEMVGGWRGC